MEAHEVALIVVGVIGSGGIGAVLKAWIDGQRAVGVARIEADVTIAPDLLKRITALEARGDKDAAEIGKLKSHVARCEDDFAEAKAEADECRENYASLSRKHDEAAEELATVRDSYDALTRSNASLSTRFMELEGRMASMERRTNTPPGGFRAVKEEED